ncbi:MAG: hypothetical protein AB8H79_17705 [Myxococcota bacterium]
MAIVISVLTPTWLLQVSDAPQSVCRTRKLKRQGVDGLVTWIGPEPAFVAVCDALSDRVAHDPADLAEQVKVEALGRIALDDAVTVVFAGWGTSPEGHRAAFRWRVTNFEGEGDDDRFEVDGAWLVQSYAQPGGLGKGKAKRSFSVQVSSTTELSAAQRSRLDRLPRELKKDPAPTTLAMDLAGLITELEGEGAVSLALLRPDGTLEGGILGTGGLIALVPHSEDGLIELRTAS